MKLKIILILIALILFVICSSSVQSQLNFGSLVNTELSGRVPDVLDPKTYLDKSGFLYAIDFVYEGQVFDVYRYDSPDSLNDFIGQYVDLVDGAGYIVTLGFVSDSPAIKIINPNNQNRTYYLLYSYEDSMLFMIPAEGSGEEKSSDLPEPNTGINESEPYTGINESEQSSELTLPEPFLSYALIDNNKKGVNLRKMPAINGVVIRTLLDGEEVLLTGMTSTANGYEWIEVRTANDEQGWVIRTSIRMRGTKSVWAKGTIFTLGEYEQDNDLENGKEPIEWQVLTVKENSVLAISKYGLDVSSYDDSNQKTTWKSSLMRDWLNGAFSDDVFSRGEYDLITEAGAVSLQDDYVIDDSNSQDHVFLLSVDEAKTFYRTDPARMCQPTEYAKAKGAVLSPNGTSWWWLRSSGGTNANAAIVDNSGFLYEYGTPMTDGKGLVRPAFWMDLSDFSESITIISEIETESDSDSGYYEGTTIYGTDDSVDERGPNWSTDWWWANGNG